MIYLSTTRLIVKFPLMGLKSSHTFYFTTSGPKFKALAMDY